MAISGIDSNAKLSVSRQAILLGISRGSVYDQPRPLSAADLKRMQWMARGFICLAAVLDAQLRGVALHPSQLWWLATAGSARALHAEKKIGNIANGVEVDLIVIGQSPRK